MSASDFLSLTYRFFVFYILLSVSFNSRISVTTYLIERSKLLSLSSVFSVLDWFEREVFDMFGILIKNHLNLTRILNDYGFYGYPLRKDFPLPGLIELFYSYIHQKILYFPLSLVYSFDK